MKHIVDSPLIDTPWQHCKVDTVFSDELWKEVEHAGKLLTPIIKDGAASIDLIEAELYGVPSSTTNRIVDFADQFLENHIAILKKFEHVTLSEHGYVMDLRWGFSKNRMDEYDDIHDDTANSTKTITFIIYISPDDEHGTLIYTKGYKYHSEIEWKPNSGLYFSPNYDVSWHSYKNKNVNVPRITLNLYFHSLDPWFDTTELQTRKARAGETRLNWFISYFKQHKLYRSSYDLIKLLTDD